MTTITVFKGDGIGPEITDAVIKVLNAANAKLEYEVFNVGAKVYEETGEYIPEKAFESYEKNKILLKSPITTPVGKGFRSLNVTLRNKYDLWANIRPAKSNPCIPTKFDEEIGIDVEKFVEEFMDLAYSVLKTWKYEDVDYYEHFIYAVLSQLEDLHDTYRNRIMMDVADLYILHGDYGLGDADYGYILRENQIKDYIYYRYASIYEGVDKDKAKQIANQALQFVDDRFTYYPNIIAVLEG